VINLAEVMGQQFSIAWESLLAVRPLGANIVGRVSVFKLAKPPRRQS